MSDHGSPGLRHRRLLSTRRRAGATSRSRRKFLKVLSAGTGSAWLSLTALGAQGQPRSATSPAAAFDPVIRGFMDERQIPGAALAVLRGPRLVYRQDYGWADRDRQTPVRPDSLFRMASLSKPITALAILKLVESRDLALDASVHDLLKLAALRSMPSDTPWDPRWEQITVRHLLHHTGGWDSQATFDPMFRPREIQSALALAATPEPWDVIRYMLRYPLDFEPGRRYAYSNFGYCLLGRIIEVCSGRPYESFVRDQLLRPLGIEQMRCGKSRWENRAPEEVRYHMPEDAATRSVFTDEEARVPWPYGGFMLELMDAHGGWLASATDLARLTAALQVPHDGPILRASTLALLQEPPAPPAARDESGRLEPAFYGLGWMVRPRGGAGPPNFWHTGSLPGTYALWVRRGDDLAYVILFNQRSTNSHERDAVIDPLLYRAADRVTLWPEGTALLPSLP